jgi:hypothetical protein
MYYSQKSENLITVMVVTGILGILFAVLTAGRSVFFNLSHGVGSNVGQIVRLENRGFSSKTWEAELIRGGMNAGSGVVGIKPFNFTIESEDLLAKVEQYRRTNTEVNISYRIEGICSPTRSESRCTFLTAIEPVNK